jgi:hypothetical protein
MMPLSLSLSLPFFFKKKKKTKKKKKKRGRGGHSDISFFSLFFSFFLSLCGGAANSAWIDTDYWCKHTAVLPGVKVAKDSTTDPSEFRYYHAAPMNSDESLVDAYKASTFDKVNMSCHDFFTAAKSG